MTKLWTACPCYVDTVHLADISITSGTTHIHRPTEIDKGDVVDFFQLYNGWFSDYTLIKMSAHAKTSTDFQFKESESFLFCIYITLGCTYCSLLGNFTCL